MKSKKDNWKAPRSNFKTSYSRTYEASPFFQFSNNREITAGGEWMINIAKLSPEAMKYLPLTNMRLVNNANEDIVIFPNEQAEGLIIPAGTILSFDRKTVPALNNLLIKNIDGSSVVGVGQLQVSFWKEAVQYDQAYSKMHKAFFNFLKVGGI